MRIGGRSVRVGGRRRDAVAETLQQLHRGDLDLVGVEGRQAAVVVEDRRVAGGAELQAVDLDALGGRAVRVGPGTGVLQVGRARLHLGTADHDRNQRDRGVERTTTGRLILHRSGYPLFAIASLSRDKDHASDLLRRRRYFTYICFGVKWLSIPHLPEASLPPFRDLQVQLPETKKLLVLLQKKHRSPVPQRGLFEAVHTRSTPQIWEPTDS